MHFQHHSDHWKSFRPEKSNMAAVSYSENVISLFLQIYFCVIPLVWIFLGCKIHFHITLTTGSYFHLQKSNMAAI